MKDEMRTRMHNIVPEEAYEHAKSAREEIRKSFYALVPPAYIEHRRKARKEMLLAARKVIDQALKKVEEREA